MKALKIIFWIILIHFKPPACGDSFGSFLDLVCKLWTVDDCICLVLPSWQETESPSTASRMIYDYIWSLIVAQFPTCHVRRILGHGDIYVAERSRHVLVTIVVSLYTALMNWGKPWGLVELYQIHKHCDGTCRGRTPVTDEESRGEDHVAFECFWIGLAACHWFVPCLSLLSWIMAFFRSDNRLTFWSKLSLKHHIRDGHGMRDLQTRCEGPWRTVEQKKRITSATSHHLQRTNSSLKVIIMLASPAYQKQCLTSPVQCWDFLLLSNPSDPLRRRFLCFSASLIPGSAIHRLGLRVFGEFLGGALVETMVIYCTEQCDRYRWIHNE